MDKNLIFPILLVFVATLATAQIEIGGDFGGVVISPPEAAAAIFGNLTEKDLIWTNNSNHVFIKGEFPDLVEIGSLALNGGNPSAGLPLAINHNGTGGISITGSNTLTSATMLSMSTSYIPSSPAGEIIDMSWTPNILASASNISVLTNLHIQPSTLPPDPFVNFISNYSAILWHPRFFSGNVTNMMGFQIDPNIDGATVGNFTGIKIENIDFAEGDNIAIHTSAGDVILGDRVSFESTLCDTDFSACYTLEDLNTTGGGAADFTNVAYLNNTQTFTGDNTFSGHTFIDGGINVSNENMQFDRGINITWGVSGGGGSDCLRWDATAPFGDPSICRIQNFNMRLEAINGQLAFQTTTIGDGASPSINLGFDTSGTDGTLTFDGTNNWWTITRPLTWTGGNAPYIIPSNIFPATNITFNNIFGTPMTLNGISLIDQNGAVSEDWHYNQTVQAGHGTNYMSVVVESSSDTLVDQEIFPFANTNYTTYTLVTHTENGINLNETLGHFNIENSGVYRYSYGISAQIGNNADEGIIYTYVNNGLNKTSSVVAQASSEVAGGSIGGLLNLNAGDNITVSFEQGFNAGVCPCSNSARAHNSFELWQIA